MVKLNKFIILSISALAIIAFAGVASASGVNIDKIQANGNYVGNPVLLSGDSQFYGYNYTFVPDGTYTVFGTLTNDGYSAPLSMDVTVDSLLANDYQDMTVTAPASWGITKGTSQFSITLRAASFDDVYVYVNDDLVDTSGVDRVNSADNMAHTVDQGPMSNLVAILLNGTFNFGNSPLYSFL